MQVKYMDWRSEQDVEEEQLGLTYHMNSNHYPQLDVLTRSRMKMLTKLFTQMKVEATAAKRHYAAPRYGLRDREMEQYPFMAELLASLEGLQGERAPFLDFGRLKNLGAAEDLDSPEIYILSKNISTGGFGLFYFYPSKRVVERVKEVDPDVWGKLFDPALAEGAGHGAVFLTANIKRSTKLFGERGYRLSLLEGGRLTERLILCSHGKEWRLDPLMTFYDLAVKDLLDIDGYYEVVLSCLIMREEE